MKLSILFISILLMISQSISPLHSRDSDESIIDVEDAQSPRPPISHISIPIALSPLSNGSTTNTLPLLPGAVRESSQNSFESEPPAASPGSLLPYNPQSPSTVSPFSVCLRASVPLVLIPPSRPQNNNDATTPLQVIHSTNQRIHSSADNGEEEDLIAQQLSGLTESVTTLENTRIPNLEKRVSNLRWALVGLGVLFVIKTILDSVYVAHHW